MKSNVFRIFLLLAPVGIMAQSFIGLNTDNYNGVHGALSNPANVVDSRTKIDINLAGISAYLSNDYASVDLSNLIGGEDFDFDDEGNLDPSANNNALFNIDILGPSVMFNIDAKNAIALTTRVRSFANVNQFPGDLIDYLESDDLDQEVLDVNNVNLGSTVHAWGEIGITYGRVLLEKDKHFLKAGITAKLLQGVGYASLKTDNFEARFDPNETTGTLDGSAEYAFSENFDKDGDNEPFSSGDDFEAEVASSGVGFDFGLVYEYRKDDQNSGLKNKNKYFLKAGLSITDIGVLNYDESPSLIYDFRGIGPVNEDDFEDLDLDSPPFSDVETISRDSKKIKLPAAMHLNLDWNAFNRLYLNLNTDLSLIGEDTADANRIENSLTLTPRLETQFFSLYSPIGIRQYSGFNWGAGFRLGPLYAGSGSIISNLASKKSKSIDIYAGLKIPIYYSKGRGKKIKDKDGDGVVDIEDNCPEEAGVISNNGCPEEVVEVIDTDNDGIEDSLDKCPREPGVPENEGCPAVDDYDGDGVEDAVDKCPNEAGLPENNGCPKIVDTDGDGVPNVLDRCPDVFGVEQNGGCPEIKTLIAESEEAKEVEKSLESYAKVINFNSGKTSFTPETFAALVSIESILKEYPNANFDINGYTDSVGAAAFNQLLSEERATAVKVYFVEKGIEAARLNAVGYGEANPIASNATAAGRRVNRRVEIKVAK